MWADLRTVDGFMTTRAPAGPSVHKRGVIEIADVEVAGGRLLLEVTAQTKRLVSRDQQSGVNAPVRVVACGATFTHRLMLEHKRPELLHVALGADFILPHELRPAALDHGTFVRVVAVSATDLAFDNGMVRRQIELGLLVQMALETGLGRFARIDDGFGPSAGFNVLAAGPVTGFTTNVLGVVAGSHQMIMGCALEVASDFFMALFAGFRANISGSGNLRRVHQRLTDAGARNHADAGQPAQHQEEDPVHPIFLSGEDFAEFAA